MAQIIDYATLKSEVAAWLHRSDLTDQIPGFIQEGENRIYRDLRVRQMETTFTDTIANGTIATPASYLEMKYLYVNASPVTKLQRKDAEWIYLNYPTRSSSGVPKFFAREAETFIFGPYPDSTYTLNGCYYKRQAALSDTNTTNWLITDAPYLILFASLCEAAPWIQNDERVVLWERKYEQIGKQLQINDEREEFSGSPLQVTAR